MECAVYIIKPEAFGYRDQIHRILNEAGLTITRVKTLVLPPEALAQLYPGLPVDLWNATMKFMRAGPSEIGIIEGKNAICRLTELAGHAVAPTECFPNTIRRRFGVATGIEMGTCVYYLNGFHRSCNKSEMMSDIELFDRL